MATHAFFDETREQSVIKAKIVADYFWAWAKVIIPTVKRKGGNRIAYIDLFAGPGRYKDGTKSTPLLVLEKAIQDSDFSNMLITIFNDRNQDHSYSLEQDIASLPSIERLRYQPQVKNSIVGQEMRASKSWGSGRQGYFLQLHIGIPALEHCSKLLVQGFDPHLQ